MAFLAVWDCFTSAPWREFPAPEVALVKPLSWGHIHSRRFSGSQQLVSTLESEYDIGYIAIHGFV